MKTIRLLPHQFPTLLKEIDPLPVFLDCAGALPPVNEDYKYLCVVGSRTHSDYGKDACQELIRGLAGYPIVVVSGMALGIDSVAHESALKAGLKTVAFPGSGLSRDVLYPREHIGLAERIILSGNTLLSPFERHQEGAPWTFPTRNRLMAGISHATLIIEGREKSGTLITAGNALEFGRDVMVVPGSIFSELSNGPHKLFKDGAIPVTCSNDILQVLGFDLEETLFGGLTDGQSADLAKSDSADSNNVNQNIGQVIDISTLDLNTDEKVVAESLWRGAKNISELIEDTRQNPMTLNIILSKLELRGLVYEKRARYHIARRRVQAE